jgi:hypothetical protein
VIASCKPHEALTIVRIVKITDRKLREAVRIVKILSHWYAKPSSRCKLSPVCRQTLSELSKSSKDREKVACLDDGKITVITFAIHVACAVTDRKFKIQRRYHYKYIKTKANTVLQHRKTKKHKPTRTKGNSESVRQAFTFRQ